MRDFSSVNVFYVLVIRKCKLRKGNKNCTVYRLKRSHSAQFFFATLPLARVNKIEMLRAIYTKTRKQKK